jgi:hypothetical protein
VSIESPDLTTAVIRLPERRIFIVLVYVEGGDTAVLLKTYNRLRKAIIEVQRHTGIVLEIIIIGDFNRYN